MSSGGQAGTQELVMKTSPPGLQNHRTVAALRMITKGLAKFNKMERLDSRGAIYSDCNAQNEQ